MGEENQICRLGVCLLMTQARFDDSNLMVRTPAASSDSTSSWRSSREMAPFKIASSLKARLSLADTRLTGARFIGGSVEGQDVVGLGGHSADDLRREPERPRERPRGPRCECQKTATHHR
mmetsp:Transcript_11636/g.38283  ORF Transcript_11636/g.38283 Transcript_11636/m.38283 type:complete len:120 (-) Transcript_11636:3-362(-)